MSTQKDTSTVQKDNQNREQSWREMVDTRLVGLGQYEEKPYRDAYWDVRYAARPSIGYDDYLKRRRREGALIRGGQLSTVYIIFRDIALRWRNF